MRKSEITLVALRLEAGVEEAMDAIFTKSSVKVCILSQELAAAFNGLTIYADKPEINKLKLISD